MDVMNLENIQIGQSIKNYKEMCTLLNENEKTGKAKITQINDWQRFMKLTRNGQKLIIEDIFETPVERVDGRKGRNSIPYLDYAKKLILDLLASNDNYGNVVYSKFALLGILKMTNENYRVGKYNIGKVAKMLELNETNVFNFFNETSKKMTEHLEKTLQSLSSQSLIFWSTEHWVSYVVSDEDLEFRIRVDGNGNRRKITTTEDGKECYVVEKRKATEDEIEYILKTEREIMLEMGCNNKGEIVRMGKYDYFIDEVCNVMLDRYHIEFYFIKYNIRFHHKHVEWEAHRLELLEREQHQDILNSGIIDRIYRQVNTRTNKALEEIEKLKENNPFFGLGEVKEDEEIHRLIHDYGKMFEVFIRKDYSDIRNEIQKYKDK